MIFTVMIAREKAVVPTIPFRVRRGRRPRRPVKFTLNKKRIMSTYCDLHTHSYYSDGTYSPAEILQEAERIGLSAVALCDHNTVDGIPAFLQAGETSPVFAIPGVELSTAWQGKELHILGLFLPKDSFPALQAYTEDYLARKEAGIREMIRRLNEDGYLLDYAALQEATPKGRLNRAHVAAALAEKGYVPSIKAAFDTLLREDGEYYVSTNRPDALEGIAFLKSLSALPVLAHPFLDLSREELTQFLPLATTAGLVGMEVLHPSHVGETAEIARALAAEHRLLPSGGSDFHGARKPDIPLGKECVPHSYFENLLNYSTYTV